MISRQLFAGLAMVVGLACGGFAQAASSGQQIYLQNCAMCHKPNGAGQPPAFPALQGGKVTTGPKPQAVAMVLNGRGAMPPWKRLSDEDIAAVMTYVRSSWGNKATPVTGKDVVAIRSAGGQLKP